MRNMDPSQMKEMLSQAKEAQKMMEEQIRRIVEEEIKKRGLVTREEVDALIKRLNS